MNIKTYYRYKFGFININDSNIYFTSTGNWSEIPELTEKKFGKTKRKISKVISVYFFFAVVFLFILFSFFRSENNLLLKAGIFLLGVFALIRLKLYFDTETGERFFIPKTKIINVMEEDNTITIVFNTLDNKEETVTVDGLEGDVNKFKDEIVQQPLREVSE